MTDDLLKLNALVISAIAWADEVIKPSEQEFYRLVLEAIPGSEQVKSLLNNYLENPPKEKEVLDELKKAPKELGIVAIKNGYLMAISDNELHEKEKQLIERFAVAMGIENENLHKFHDMLLKYHASYEIEKELFY